MKIGRLFKYLTLYFASVVIEASVKAWKPEWAPYVGALQTCVIVWVAYVVIRALVRKKTQIELELEAAEEAALAAQRERDRLQMEAYEREQEERRQARNARQRERRAAKRAREAQAEIEAAAKKASRQKPAPPVDGKPRSRWDRLLDDDE